MVALPVQEPVPWCTGSSYKPRVCTIQSSSLRSVKSSRACAPRLSLRASAPCTVIDACERVLELEGLDEVGVPDERLVLNVHLLELERDFVQLLAALRHHVLCAVDRGVVLH